MVLFRYIEHPSWKTLAFFWQASCKIRLQGSREMKLQLARFLQDMQFLDCSVQHVPKSPRSKFQPRTFEVLVWQKDNRMAIVWKVERKSVSSELVWVWVTLSLWHFLLYEKCADQKELAKKTVIAGALLFLFKRRLQKNLVTVTCGFFCS